jgi:hypothetical protein
VFVIATPTGIYDVTREDENATRHGYGSDARDIDRWPRDTARSARPVHPRGYRNSDNNPDFDVPYYAGAGHVDDTRASLTKYPHNGEKLTTQIAEYPAGTIVLDVVEAKTDSLVWRGTALADISQDPNDYARAVRKTVDKIAQSFPKAQP